MRRTKILATLGPASESKEVLTQMIQAGLNAVRCNFSHGTAQDHQDRIKKIRDVSAKAGKTIGILADLQGGIQSGMSYSGATSIQELQAKAKFTQQTVAGQAESFTHILTRNK